MSRGVRWRGRFERCPARVGRGGACIRGTLYPRRERIGARVRVYGQHLAPLVFEVRSDRGKLCAPARGVDFGRVFVGEARERSAAFTNCGRVPIQVEAPVFTGGTRVFSAPMEPRVMLPGEVWDVPIGWTPEVPGVQEDRVRLEARADGLRVEVPVRGEALPDTGCVLAFPEALDFGTPAAGAPTTRMLEFQSVGACACTLERIGLEGDPAFSARALPVPYVLRGQTGCPGDPPGAGHAPDSMEWPVVYAPPRQAKGDPDRGAFRVIHGAGEARVALEGRRGGRCEPLVDAALSFGEVDLGSITRTPVRIVNAGDADCEWAGAHFSPQARVNGFDQAGEPNSFPTTIPVGAARLFGVALFRDRLVPPDEPADTHFEALTGEDDGCEGGAPTRHCNWVDFEIGDAVSPRGVQRVRLEATPVLPIVATPTPLDFGAVRPRCASEARVVRLRHTAGLSVPVGEPQVDGEFEVVATSNVSGIWPMPLAPEEVFEVWVRFVGADASGSLHVPMMQEPTWSAAVPLRGRIDTRPRLHQVFEVVTDAPVDILWVLDNSSSMQAFQESLSTGLAAFARDALMLGTNFHLGVTTTLSSRGSHPAGIGPDDPGGAVGAGMLTACPGNAPFVTGAADDALAAFACNTAVSDPAHVYPPRPILDVESGLFAAYTAVTPPQSDGYNAGFSRDEARLHIIIVSDEVDQSVSPADAYIDAFRRDLPRGKALLVSAIAAPPEDCIHAQGTLDGDRKYADVVEAFGGSFFPLCEADLTPAMHTLAARSFAPQRVFPLENTADPLSIQVCVRDAPGAPCQPRAFGTGLRFDSAANAVVFTEAASPPFGAHVEVSYSLYCTW